jgi:hypothetical protein
LAALDVSSPSPLGVFARSRISASVVGRFLLLFATLFALFDAGWGEFGSLEGVAAMAAAAEASLSAASNEARTAVAAATKRAMLSLSETSAPLV